MRFWCTYIDLNKLFRIDKSALQSEMEPVGIFATRLAKLKKGFLRHPVVGPAVLQATNRFLQQFMASTCSTIGYSATSLQV